MGQAVDQAGNVWETDATGKAVRFLRKATPSGPPQKPSFQYEGQQAAANVGLTEAQIRAANARTEQMARDTALAEKRFAADQANQRRPQISPVQRDNAIKAWSGANEITQILPDVERQFNEGPGATRGIRSLLDFIPSAENETFNKAGDRLRAPLKSVLGFQGGDTNAASEAEMNVGPFVPRASRFDATNKETLAAVRAKAGAARTRAAMQLGGIPDSNGRVTPIPQGYRMGEFPDLDEAIATRIDRIPLKGRQEFIKDARRRYLAIRQRSTRDEDVLIEKYLR